MTLTKQEDWRVSLEQKNLLRRITDRIRRSLELQDILTATVAEVRSLLGTDRVKIYKFNHDHSGQVVAESIKDNRLPSLLGLNFPADDIPEYARELFIKSRVRSVINVDSCEIGQSPLRNLETGEEILENIRYRPLDPCHVEYLTAMGVMSSLVAPILNNEELWGLLVSHHSQPRSIPEYELEAVQMVVDQLSVAIAQSNLLSIARAKAAREAIINRIATLLHSLPTIELQPALEECLTAFSACGGRLCIKSSEAFNIEDNTVNDLAKCLESGSDYLKVYTSGQQPLIPELARYPLMEQYSVWQERYKSGEYDIWAISDIYQTSGLRNLQVAFKPTKIRSILMIPLQYRQQLLGYLTIFRDEVETETLWAGNCDPDQRQLYPRLSFEVWRESKKAQAQEWTPDEIELAHEIGQQFSTAIYQYELYQHVHKLNNNLEYQVQERTAKLQQATEQQQILFEVVTKMRESLDLDTIFGTTTRELRRVLNADRVAVYRFQPGSEFNDGEFITEDVLSNLPSALAIKVQDHCFGEIYATKYRHGRVHTVADIDNANLQDCHIAVLSLFQIRAQIVMPLMKSNDLWGLLCIHQCHQPRNWESSEIQFATQIAYQLGVALEQADLLAQTRRQAQKLSEALHDLQQTQTQLIQTEKMSSLGQLVAGVAHEINNPVNFISGNLGHVTEYAQDLLKMLALYQQECVSSNSEIYEQAQKIDLEFIAEDLPRVLNSLKVGSDRIRQIVVSLRNFSRLDQAEMKAVDIHEGIDSTLLILQHRLKATGNNPGIQVIKEYANLPLIECYAGQLNQVFMNILSNAIDALEEAFFDSDFSLTDKPNQKPQIRIVTEVISDSLVVIRIADNGSGIPQEDSAQIFDPFFTTKPIGKGTGLGLSISYQIVVDKHGGIFKYDSELGYGTEFLIQIPIKQLSKNTNF